MIVQEILVSCYESIDYIGEFEEMGYSTLILSISTLLGTIARTEALFARIMICLIKGP